MNRKIKKGVIPAAGLGTRLLPLTKELPKEMLPIFYRTNTGIALKPIIQQIYETIFDIGVSELCFIVGRGKGAIQDHFTQDYEYIKMLKEKTNNGSNLEEFYSKLDKSNIIFTHQPIPQGFGDAVLRAKLFVGDESFIVHAGDDLILSENNDHYIELIEQFYKQQADCIFFVEKIKNPEKYGVIEGVEVEPNIYRVENIIEKPINPPSDLAVIAIYVFKPIIFDALEHVIPDDKKEIQLTDAIKYLIDNNYKVYAIKISDKLKRIDVGTPESYLNAIISTVEKR